MTDTARPDDTTDMSTAITHAVPGWALPLWQAAMCPRGVHAFDEVISLGQDDEEHYLHCDACGLRALIDDVEEADARTPAHPRRALLARSAGLLVDALDATLAKPAELALHLLGSRNAARAMTDPRYRELRAKRDPHPFRATLEQWNAEFDLLETHSDHPRWEPAARALTRRPLRSAVSRVRCAVQRLTRSWDDTATYNLDDHLASTLGAQLLHLADIAHGWPQSEEFPTFADYQDALRTHGTALLAYANRWSTLDAADHAEQRKREEELRVAAAAALHWVAEHFGSLWD